MVYVWASRINKSLCSSHTHTLHTHTHCTHTHTLHTYTLHTHTHTLHTHTLHRHTHTAHTTYAEKWKWKVVFYPITESYY